MIPDDIDGAAWIEQLADRVDRLQGRAEIEAAIGNVEYLMEALDPALHEPASRLVEALRRRLEAASG